MGNTIDRQDGALLCAGCRFWYESTPRDGSPRLGPWGDCRRHAPRPAILSPEGVDRAEVAWPETWHGESCGDGEERWPRQGEDGPGVHPPSIAGGAS